MRRHTSRSLLSRSLQSLLFLVVVALFTHLTALGGYAQLATNNGATDIGPRNPGTVPFDTVCPVGNPVKFPPTAGNPNCVDIDQPPSQSPQPPAGGAGNVVGVGSGNPLAGLWFESINVFEAVASVQGASVVAAEPIVGLGPSFNSNSCVSCHEAPTVGGTSGGSVNINGTTFNMPLSFSVNPELLAMADQSNTFNQNPNFPAEFNPSGPGFTNIPFNGPSLEVRVIPGGGSGGLVIQPDGVAELFSIEGRSDAPGCTLPQFPFSSLPARSISFRIPTPTFGLGFVEATPDAALVANLAINDPTLATTAANLGISGTFNRNNNDGTITRFGWKAQNKSLMIFAGEASNVEMGVTNELFPNEKSVAAGASCPTSTAPAGNQPEDEILPATFPAGTSAASIASIISSNSQNNAVFMRMNAAPSQCDAVTLLTTDPYGTTGPPQCPPFTTTQVKTGQSLFNNNTLTGCALCHRPNLTSGLSQNAALSSQQFHPYSDFALHDMGPVSNGLADGIMQGLATSQFFRTAPLWGTGQRLFFLHDGRAFDLATAIADHCPNPSSAGTNESCGSIALFNALTKAQQQDILDFLRSL